MQVQGVIRAGLGAGLLLLLAYVGDASAQPSSGAPSPATMLHLGATASVQAPPDQLVADLVAQATSRSPAAAQRQVNTLIADGMKTAQGVAGVDAQAIGYAVDPADDKHAAWAAQQTLELRGADGPSLLDLAGRLQEHGLVMASLDWQLSDAARVKAHDTATVAALKALQARARDAAGALGMHVDHLSDVRLDETPAFQPRPGPVMMMAARAAPPPQATAAPETVSADVSADVVLHP